MLAVLFVAACSSSGRQVRAGDDPSPSGSTETTRATDLTVGTAVEPSRDGFTDCGTFDLASGWPTTIAPSPSLYACLDGAFRSGTPARLVLSAQTDGEGGSPVTTTYLVTGQGIVHVTVDATRAADRPPVVSTEECRGLVATAPEPAVSNCENMAD